MKCPNQKKLAKINRDLDNIDHDIRVADRAYTDLTSAEQVPPVVAKYQEIKNKLFHKLELKESELRAFEAKHSDE